MLAVQQFAAGHSIWQRSCIWPDGRQGQMLKRIAIALLGGVLVIPVGFAADQKQQQQEQQQTPQHMDPYVQGPSNEARLIKEVRHQLVLLPYYSIFDDLGFRVDG